MSNDPLGFLTEAPSDAPVAAETPSVEATPSEVTQEPSSGPVRDEKGRFAPISAQTEPVPTEQPAEPVAPDPALAAPDPIADAIKAAEDRIRAEYDKKIGGLQSALTAKREQVRQPKKEAPAYFTQEDHAYVSEIEAAAEQRAFDRLSKSSFNRFAKANGADLAQQVADWAGAKAEQDPRFNDRLIASDDPLEDAYEVFQQDPAQQIAILKAELAALKGGEVSPNPAPDTPGASPAPAPVTPPPRSIANAASAGGAAHVPSGPGQSYASVFNKG